MLKLRKISNRDKILWHFPFLSATRYYSSCAEILHINRTWKVVLNVNDIKRCGSTFCRTLYVQSRKHVYKDCVVVNKHPVLITKFKASQSEQGRVYFFYPKRLQVVHSLRVTTSQLYRKEWVLWGVYFQTISIQIYGPFGESTPALRAHKFCRKESFPSMGKQIFPMHLPRTNTDQTSKPKSLKIRRPIQLR